MNHTSPLDNRETTNLVKSLELNNIPQGAYILIKTVRGSYYLFLNYKEQGQVFLVGTSQPDTRKFKRVDDINPIKSMVIKTNEVFEWGKKWGTSPVANFTTFVHTSGQQLDLDTFPDDESELLRDFFQTITGTPETVESPKSDTHVSITKTLSGGEAYNQDDEFDEDKTLNPDLE